MGIKHSTTLHYLEDGLKKQIARKIGLNTFIIIIIIIIIFIIIIITTFYYFCQIFIFSTYWKNLLTILTFKDRASYI
jgi:hypothetical protein